MRQIDWIGEPERKPFRDIRNTRDAVAEEKALLCRVLGELLRFIPPRIKSGGSVNEVRAWRHDCDACRKVVGNKRATVPELKGAVARMEAWKKEKP